MGWGNGAYQIRPRVTHSVPQVGGILLSQGPSGQGGGGAPRNSFINSGIFLSASVFFRFFSKKQHHKRDSYSDPPWDRVLGGALDSSPLSSECCLFVRSFVSSLFVEGNRNFGRSFGPQFGKTSLNFAKFCSADSLIF